MIKSNLNLLLLTSAALLQLASAGEYTYATNGADWPAHFPECGLNNQSPIDLKSHGSDESFSVIDATRDEFNKIYTNQVGDIKVEWKGEHTTQVSVNKEGQALQSFSSQLADINYGAHPIFTGVQFHFHAGSEHTVDGVRQDLEMHTVHLANSDDNGGVPYAAMGIMFSVNDYTADVTYEEQEILTRFFDSLEWADNGDPLVPEVPYGELMMMVDMKNRWVYKGSVTTPPCATYVYWNVVHKIYPVSQEHLNLFKAQLSRGPHGLGITGNWRVIQPYNQHQAYLVQTDLTDKDDFSQIISIALGILAGILMVSLLYCANQRSSLLRQVMSRDDWKPNTKMIQLRIDSEM